ncbi:DUF6900 domain-containing protein [Paraburkholderia monticola]|uniref:DUF6900 domain-containing protein n=1 Tax=Paraburkholderia monticola TaxID=1399968 RepID=UPI0007C87C53|nr:hypothetical protein [Paraburkholderia monticola]
MDKAVEKAVHWERLEAIASEELGIGSLTESGKISTDVQLVRIGDLANALQRAYDFGLLMGHTVARAEQLNTPGYLSRCLAEQDVVRAAADDILVNRSHSH